MNKTIHELNSLTQAQADDEFIIYDVSEGESKKIQVQALNNPNYSTTEQKTGGTWIDGKPIYRKVFTGLNYGGGSTNTYINTGATVSNVDTLISVRGGNSTNKVCVQFLGYVMSGDNIQYWTNVTWGNLNYLIAEYTKTTD